MPANSAIVLAARLRCGVFWVTFLKSDLRTYPSQIPSPAAGEVGSNCVITTCYLLKLAIELNFIWPTDALYKLPNDPQFFRCSSPHASMRFGPVLDFVRIASRTGVSEMPSFGNIAMKISDAVTMAEQHLDLNLFSLLLKICVPPAGIGNFQSLYAP